MGLVVEDAVAAGAAAVVMQRKTKVQKKRKTVEDFAQKEGTDW